VESVQFLVDGAAIGADTQGADGWSVSWDTNPVARGSHSITAVVTDRAGNSTTSDPVQVTVADPPVADPPMLSIPVAQKTDDADELQGGTVRTTTGDVELGMGSEGIPTTAGLRFTGVQVPAGANILYADVQFQVDETKQTAANFVIRAQQSDNPTTFLSSTAFNVSSRPVTSQSVAWAPPGWSVLGAAGPDQRTPDLQTVIQEVVNRPGWSSGNALAIIITGSGRRTAESFDGGAPPPILHIRYATP
jgi:hypothetical protein